jgi:predicted transcriptional regulator
METSFMQIDLPQELYLRLHQRAQMEQGMTEVGVIELALDKLEWQEREIAAIQEGIDAWRAGDVRDFAEFAAEFRKKHGIPSDA